MKKLNLKRREASVHNEEFEPPAYALRNMSSVAKLSKDNLSREITLLLIANPEMGLQFDNVDPDSMSASEKAVFLVRIKKSLDIRPIRARRLGYVGPENDSES